MIQRPLTMADHPHRLEKNAPGDWYTTGECLWCGAPELEAPELLHPLTDDDLETYFVRQPATPAEIERACRAASVCCVTSIRYGGRDPELISRLGNTGEYCDFVVDDVGALRAAPPWHPPASPRPVASAPNRRHWWQLWRRRG
jgi:hypothetical protein